MVANGVRLWCLEAGPPDGPLVLLMHGFPEIAYSWRNQIGALTAFGLKYGLSVGIATSEARGESHLPVGGFGWYGIYSTWFWTLPRQRAAVLFFGNVLTPGMNLSLFSKIVEVIKAVLA